MLCTAEPFKCARRHTLMFTRSKLTHIFVALLAVAFLFICLPRTAAADDDPPARVGRLAYLRGSVSFQPAGSDDWGAAEINRPITIGDKLWTDQDSLAEIGLGAAVIRLSSNTAFTILNLDDNVTQISVNEGTISVHLRRLDQDDSFEVDTPNIAFSLLRPGDYRIEVNENGDATYVTVRAGEGEVTGGGQAFAVRPGQTATITGTDQVDSEVDDAYPNDDFDNWCNDRNRREDNVPRYVSRTWSATTISYDTRRFDRRAGLRSDVDADGRRGGLGAVSLWPLGLDHAVGLDVGR